jgi:D-alanyl-D-alanine dipeptidase
LLAAQVHLQGITTGVGLQPLRLGIFDAWRPVSVQAFMVNHAIEQECARQGINTDDSDQLNRLENVRSEVARFWAPPSTDLLIPPPHSTGAAVDLTLIDAQGSPLDMGGEIDAIGPESLPLHHAKAAIDQPDGTAALFHSRRCLLHCVMTKAGFVRHPNEWWHFSFGDQLWAWTVDADCAIYGRDLTLFSLEP